MLEQNHLEKGMRDVQGITHRMAKTLSSRRAAVIQGIHLAELKTEYPLLFDGDEVAVLFKM